VRAGCRYRATLFTVADGTCGVTWADLFARAAEYEVSEADVREAVARRREDGDA
jgi:hypothetical protein